MRLITISFLLREDHRKSLKACENCWSSSPRLSFGIKVISIGRYRMLKDVATGQVLKTKSEISALQAFIAWLAAAADVQEVGPAAKIEANPVAANPVGGQASVILVSHEQDRQVLAPLLMQALEKYQLLQSFSNIVRGNNQDLAYLYFVRQIWLKRDTKCRF